MRVKPLPLHTNQTKTNFEQKREHYYGQPLCGMLVRNNRNLDLYANMADVNVCDFMPCEPCLNIPEENNSIRRALKYIFCTIWQLGFATAIIYALLSTNKFFNFHEHFIVSKTDNSDGKSLNEEFCNGVNKNVLDKLHEMSLNYKSIVFKLKSSMYELDGLRLEIASLKSKLKNLNVTNEIIEAINKYDADKIGIIDYALEPIGGAIISTPDTTPYPSQMAFNVLGLLSVQYSSNPRVVIQSTTQPGECFAFYGSQGKIRIYLAQEIKITSVTLEHAHRSLLVDTASTPKEFSVFGLSNAHSKGDLLGTYTYDINGRPIQTFNITYMERPKSYQHVELQVLSNYGKKEYTCVYRFRVHGTSN